MRAQVTALTGRGEILLGWDSILLSVLTFVRSAVQWRVRRRLLAGTSADDESARPGRYAIADARRRRDCARDVVSAASTPRCAHN
jgi:hypothetical protein